MEIAFMIFGIIFFAWSMHKIERDHNSEYGREVHYRREFGEPMDPSWKQLFKNRQAKK